MNEFEKWLKAFLKRPILVEQEAQIVAAMLDGTINKEGAKKVFQWVVEQNLKAHKEIMNMSMEELFALCDEYGVEYDSRLNTSK